MKTKFYIHFAFFSFLTVSMTGCCTRALIDASTEKHVMTYQALAIYRSKVQTNSVVLDGEFNQIELFLKLPAQHSQTDYTQTNADFWARKIENYSIHSFTHMERYGRLPDEYDKVCDLPTNDFRLTFHSKTTNRGCLYLIPVSIVADATFLPLELLFMNGFATSIPIPK